MATFKDLLAKLEQGKVPKLTWLCGSESVLIEEAVNAIRATLAVEEMNSVTHFAVSEPVSKVWNSMSQFALDASEERLVVVREAHLIKNRKATPFAKSLESKLVPWLKDAGGRMPVYVVMVSSQEWEPDFMPDVRKRVIGAAYSLYVECKLSKTAGSFGDKKKNVPADPKDTHGNFYSKGEQQAAEIITKLWSNSLSFDMAMHLAQHTGSDLARCRDTAMWIDMLGPKFKVTKRGIEVLASESPNESFATALIRLDKASAMNYCKLMDVNQQREAIIELQRALSDLETINRAMKPALLKIGGDRTQLQWAKQDVVASAGIARPAVDRYWNDAKMYDSQAVSRRTEALIRADSHRNNEGVLETLVAEW